MRHRFATLALAALALTGCSTSLPSMQTEGPWAGRCFTINYIPIFDMGAYMAADMMDGWKCAGIRDGELPRGGTKAEYVAAMRAGIAVAQDDARLLKQAGKATGPARASVATPPAKSAEPITWATGD